jgi:5-methylcytosine-specific restriction endonuclease McrA
VARKTEPFPHHTEWTYSRFWSFVRSALRAAYNKYPPKYEALRMARRPVSAGRQKWAYTCAICKQEFMQKDVQVDHIEPAGTLKNYSDLPDFVSKLFCGVEGLRILCKPCHQNITNQQTEERKRNK